MEKVKEKYRLGGIPHKIQRQKLPSHRVAHLGLNQRARKKYEKQNQPLQ